MDATLSNQFLPPRTFTKTLAVGDSIPIDGPGVYARIIASTGPVSVGFDNGTPIPGITTGQGFKCLDGQSFTRVTLENPVGSAGAVTVTMVIGNMILEDNRFNIGTSTAIPVSETDPNFIVGATIDTTPSTAAALAGINLLVADPGRREVWLWTSDPGNLAWWGESQAQALAGQAAGSPDPRQIGLSIEGFTFIRSRAAIWVAAANGVTIRAIVFKA